MSNSTPSGDIPTPFATEGSPPGEDWQEVRDADTGELLAYGRRIDGPEAERLGQVMQSMPIAAGPGLDRTAASTPNGSASDHTPLLFGGKPMPAGHFHFALPLPGHLQATEGNGDGEDTDEEDLRAERARLRHEEKEQRHQDKMRERANRVIRNARSERKANRKAETKRKRIRSGKRSLNRRR